MIVRRSLLAVGYAAIALAAGFLCKSGPEAARLALAWLYLVGAPSVFLALSRGRARARLDALALGAGENIAIFSALALVLECVGGRLSTLIVLHPVLVGGVIVARGALARGDTSQLPREAAMAGTRPPTIIPASFAIVATVLGIAVTAVAILRPRAPDFRQDVYDHVGAAARVAARDKIFSRELGDGEAGAHQDPRKGTWSAMLAAALRLSHVEPLAMWRSATLVGVLFGVLAFARLARAFVGGASWPVALLILVLAWDGGPAADWFSHAAYPGSIGLFLYALFLAECSSAHREGRRMPILLAFALPLVHAMAGLLALVALVAFSLARSGRRKAVAAAALALVCASAWRVLAAGPLTNPIQVETEGVLILPGGLLAPEPVTICEFMGIGGLLGLLLAPLLRDRARNDLGARWVLVLVASFLVLASPPIATLLAHPLGYLLRRLPALVPFPLVLSWVLIDSIGTLAAPGAPASAPRWAHRIGGVLVLALVARWCGDAAALAARRTPDEHASVRNEVAWTRALEGLRGAIPPRARVATDPVTSYVLYARTLAKPVVLADQHSSPNDAEEPRRLRDLARILSPWTRAETRDSLLAARGATHVLVNEGLGETIRTFGTVTRQENVGLLRAFLDADTSRFEAVATSGPLRLYAIRPPRADAPRPPAPSNPVFVSAPPEGPTFATGSGISVAGARAYPKRLGPGEVVTVECALSTNSESMPIGNYLAYIALTPLDRHEHDVSRKIVRRLGRLLGKASDRTLAEPDVTSGIYPVILWRRGETIADRYGIRVPRGAPPGRYAVTLNIVRSPVFKNRTLEALLTDRDEYAAIAVDTVDVTR